MANKRKSKKRDNQSQGSESALLDMSDRDVKKMIKAAKSQGFVTYEQLNKVTSAESLTSEQIEDVMSMLSEMGINVIENEEEEQSTEITSKKLDICFFSEKYCFFFIKSSKNELFMLFFVAALALAVALALALASASAVHVQRMCTTAQQHQYLPWRRGR